MTELQINGMVIDEEKKQRILNLFKSFKEIDACIEPFREQRKDLRASYIEEGWLTKDEYKLVQKAYRALKQNENLDEIKEMAQLGSSEVP